MKKLISVLMFSILLFNCSSNEVSTNKLGAANPLIEVDSSQEFKKLGLDIKLPKGTEDVSYFILDKNIAQVNFVLQGNTYILRKSSRISSDKLHGYYYEFKEKKEVEEDNFTLEIMLLEGRDGGLALGETKGETPRYFSLTTKDKVTEKKLEEIMRGIIR